MTKICENHGRRLDRNFSACEDAEKTEMDGWVEGGLTSVMKRRSCRELKPQQSVPLWDCPGLQTTGDKNVDPFRQTITQQMSPGGLWTLSQPMETHLQLDGLVPASSP